jgi:hypothetical protein
MCCDYYVVCRHKGEEHEYEAWFVHIMSRVLD